MEFFKYWSLSGRFTRARWWRVPILYDAGAYAVGSNYALYLAAPAALINLWALIELGFRSGSLGPNSYGEDPTGAGDLPPPLPVNSERA